MTISATCTWREAGSSKVLLTTSALVLRSMSVTSSGRSSISRTISTTSGWFLVMALAIFCSRTVLPVRGGATISMRWPLPIGVTRSTIRMFRSLGSCFQHQPAIGMQRGEVLEIARVGDALGVFAVDGLDAQQGEIALRFLGRADLALHDVAVAQAEAANLAGADVDVVGAGQIVVFRAAQEAEAVGEDFQDAFAVHQAVLADAGCGGSGRSGPAS